MDQELIQRLIEKAVDAKLEPLYETIENLKLKVTKMEELVKTKNNLCNSLESSLSFLSSKFDDIFPKMEILEKSKAEHSNESNIQRSEIFRLNNSIKQLEEDLNELQQYSRRDCLEIRGIPFHQDEDTDDTVKKVAELIDVDVEDDEISISHRLPTDSKVKRDPAIIVKFVRRNTRDEFYGARKHLRNKTTKDLGYTRTTERKIYISESLTRENRKLFNACLALKKELNYKFIWTKNGTTLLRRNGSSPVIAISNSNDLEKFKQNQRHSKS